MLSPKNGPCPDRSWELDRSAGGEEWELPGAGSHCHCGAQPGDTGMHPGTETD